MKSLSNSDKEQRDRIVSELNEIHERLSKSIADISDATAEHNNIIAEYNNKLQEARDFAEHISAGIGDYMDEKSEKWLDSERGEAFQEWKDEWDGFDPQDLEDVELPDVDVNDAEELGQLPEEPSE